jgi:hypothetical protein
MELTTRTLVVAEPTSASPATAAAVDPTMRPAVALPALPALPEIVLSPWALLGAVSGLLLAVGVLLVTVGVGGVEAAADADPGAGPDATRFPRRFGGRWRLLARAARVPGLTPRGQRARIAAWVMVGVVVWPVTGWPVAGVALAVVGVWLPWLLGSARLARAQIDQLEAVEAWCRRLADTLSGGGAVGLVQAVEITAQHAPEQIRVPVGRLAQRLRLGGVSQRAALREFADGIDDRVGDTVAAALLLAFDQQSGGVARVLRQLAAGVARDVRARRDIEAERAEARQSMRMLLLIQIGVLGLLVLVPGFAAPYRTEIGQLVMAMLLAGTAVLLVWMRRLANGRPAPRFLGTTIGAHTGRPNRGARGVRP